VKGEELHFLTLPGDEGIRMDVWLSGKIGDISRSRVQQLIADGHVSIDGKTIKPSRLITGGLDIRVFIPAAKPTEILPQNIPLKIVYQDSDLAVIEKPAGLVVHPAQGHEDGTLVNALLHHLGDLSGIGGKLKPGIVHRLDKGTSGLMIISKNDASHAELQRQFASRKVEKKYLAVVYGSPRNDEGVFDTGYGRNPRDRKKFSSRVVSDKRAITRWRVIERFKGISLIEAGLVTGRTHQIRVHFADQGMPLLGDLQYGASRRARQILPVRARELVLKLDRVMLHAAEISFTHPRTGSILKFKAEMPDEMKQILNELRGKS